MVNGNLSAMVVQRYYDLPPFSLFQLYYQSTLAIISLLLGVYSFVFIIRHELPARHLQGTFKTIFSPMTFLLVPVFLSDGVFYMTEAVFYTSLNLEIGYGLFFFCGISQVSIAWFSWLRSKSVVSLYCSTKGINILELQLKAIPFIFAIPCVIQFLPILNPIQYASIVIAVGVALVINVDVYCLMSYSQLIFSLKENNVDIPPAYHVIAKYTGTCTILRLIGLCCYSVSAYLTDYKAAMALVMIQDLFMFLDVVGLMTMKFELIKPGFLELNWSGGGTKHKVKGFLDGSDTPQTTIAKSNQV